MQLGLKIWRSSGAGGERELREYEVDDARRGDAARRARARQGPPRRHARLSAQLPDDDLRLLRDAHRRPDGARLQAADARVRGGGEGAGDLADGQPADRQGPRRRHGAVLGQVPRRRPVPAARVQRAARRARARDLAAAHGRDPQGVALHQLRRVRVGVQRVGVEPRLPRARRRSRRRCASSATRATARRTSASRS